MATSQELPLITERLSYFAEACLVELLPFQVLQPLHRQPPRVPRPKCSLQHCYRGHVPPHMRGMPTSEHQAVRSQAYVHSQSSVWKRGTTCQSRQRYVHTTQLCTQAA